MTSGSDRDVSFDSVIVVWQTIGIDEVSRSPRGVEPESAASGSSAYSAGAVQQTYLTASVFRSNLFRFQVGDLLKREWGHGILFYSISDRRSAKARR